VAKSGKQIAGIIVALGAVACLSQFFAAVTQNDQWLIIGKGADGSIDDIPAYGLGIFVGLPLAAAALSLLNFGKKTTPSVGSANKAVMSGDMRKLLSAVFLVLLMLGGIATIMLLIAFSQL